jgi:hypothetical protein
MKAMKLSYMALAVLMLAACSDSTGPEAVAVAPAVTRIIGVVGSLAFGNLPVSSSAILSFTITNSGNATLTVSAITATEQINSVLLASWLGGSIGPGASQEVTVQFAPASAQSYNGTISIVSDATSGTNSLPVSGTGTAVVQVATPGYYVWSGQQYLGYFTCVFCTDFGSDSINNPFGRYGSQFSSTSIRNQFSTYGSAFSSSSACNQFASNPPQVFNSTGSVYFGELTLNQFRGDAIRTAAIVNWLTNNVCRH